jgi:rare lipoprotein A
MAGRLAIQVEGVLKTSVVVCGLTLGLAACASAPTPSPRLSENSGRVRAYNRPYEVRGRWYTPADQPGYDKVGLASWYSYESRSRTTADGEPFDARLATAAHTTLPIPSWIEVTNLDNGRSARVRLNDRGPFVAGRILDLSKGAAEELGFLQRGTARVRVRYLGPAEPLSGARTMWARSRPPPRLPQTDAPHPMVMMAEAAPRPRARPSSAGPSMSEAEVDKDLADFGGADAEVQMTPPTADAPALSVQAGAFSDRGNAERAAERLSSTGLTRVSPVTRSDGEVLYRVLVQGGAGTSPQSTQARVAALGFADAKVVAP